MSLRVWYPLLSFEDWKPFALTGGLARLEPWGDKVRDWLLMLSIAWLCWMALLGLLVGGLLILLLLRYFDNYCADTNLALELVLAVVFAVYFWAISSASGNINV